MNNSDTTWLREQMRQNIASSAVIDPTDNVLHFRPPSFIPTSQGAAALALVNQAANLIEDIDHRATERHARAEALAEKAIEKLKIANDRACFAETARQVVEAELKVHKDRMERLNTKLLEIEKIADDRIRSAESARHAAETELEEYKDSVKRFTAKVEKMEKAIERAVTRSVAAQAEQAAAEQRTISAEVRANEAENTLKRIEAAIRTQILEKNLSDPGRRAIRAA